MSMPPQYRARNVARFLLAALLGNAVLTLILSAAMPPFLSSLVIWFLVNLYLVLPLWLLALPVLLTTDPTKHPHALGRYVLSAAVPPLLLLFLPFWLRVFHGPGRSHRLLLSPSNFHILAAGTALSILTTAIYLYASRRREVRP